MSWTQLKYAAGFCESKSQATLPSLIGLTVTSQDLLAHNPDVSFAH